MTPRGRIPVIAFALSIVASLGLMAVYGLRWGSVWQGVLLGVTLGGIGVGLITWSKQFLPEGGETQTRESLVTGEGEERETAESFERGTDILERRRFLVRVGGAALGALGLAALFPIRSLGGRPGNRLIETAWGDGVRLVDSDGEPIRPADLAVGEVMTVFPDGNIGSGDAVSLLIGLDAGVNRPLAGRESWDVGGLVSYSKLCTHVGCPVGLYEPTRHRLFCPCHQSVFEVADGARPSGGPATRALPQLPLGVDGQGYLIARGDFSEAPGAGFWSRPGRD